MLDDEVMESRAELEDKPQEECGVFGIFARGEEVARVAFYGLFALQHRGQESAGISVTDGWDIITHKRMGLVNQVFDEAVLRELSGIAAIGHTRYSTTGSSVQRNAQPVVAFSREGPVAVAHNGNLLNTVQLRRWLEDQGREFETTNDSEVIAHLIAHFYQGDLAEAISKAMQEIHGAYSLTVLTRNQLAAVRDPYGLRPLCIGEMPSGAPVFSSETCGLHPIGARFIREVEPGEVIIADREGVRETQGMLTARRALCVLEFIYLARPDSTMYGRSLHLARRRMGHELAKECPALGAQLVVPVPDSGFPAAIGFHEASRIPFGEGFVKSRYIQRTFIQPDPAMRALGAKMKYTALVENVSGRKVVLVDDSIVRGTTTGKIVSLLFEAGAVEVHVRISSPPVKFPCFYGIDMANQKELIGARMSVPRIQEHIGATSLGYLSLGGLMRAIDLPRDRFCSACFTGNYPIPIPEDLKVSKFALETVAS